MHQNHRIPRRSCCYRPHFLTWLIHPLILQSLVDGAKNANASLVEDAVLIEKHRGQREAGSFTDLFAVAELDEPDQLDKPTHLDQRSLETRASYDTIQGKSCFRSMQGMMDSMFDLEQKYPDLVSISDIGDSYLKNNNGFSGGNYNLPSGYDIYVIKVTDRKSSQPSSDKGKMLITSGAHAREIAPPELLARFIEMMVQNYNVDADITWILQQNEIHAVLYVNPDGRYLAERYPDLYWRKNANPGGSKASGCRSDEYGTDLNRNYDFVWGDRSGASSNPCVSDYYGSSAESEPETKAIASYARSLFPSSQRKNNPERDMDIPFGEGITGMYIDIHSSGGYVYYPWGHKDATSPDDEALQALGRKIHYFNGYKLWAGGQPDFLYPASGDASDYMYGALGVASYGLEIGEDFYESCNLFEREITSINLPALLYSAKLVKRPFQSVKGPDILQMDAVTTKRRLRVTVVASDDKMVNTIKNFPNHKTGNQDITSVQLFLDVHPEEYKQGDYVWQMRSRGANSSGEEQFGRSFALSRLAPGRHVLYARAKDSDGYFGPVSSVFFEVPDRRGLRGVRG